jgi:L-threonylcarbamoyladenylate synthase
MTDRADRTERWLGVDPRADAAIDLTPAVAWLARGGIVLMPTDTFYGLAVDPTSDDAVRALFDLKGRDPNMAVPLIAASREAVERLCVVDAVSARLALACWPGPLSLIFDAPSTIARGVHGGRQTIAVRVPADGIARSLAAAFGGIITATSANRSGAPPASRVEDVDDVADDPRVFVIDAGPTPGGAPSTIVDARSGAPVLVREGATPWSRVLGSMHP